MSAKPLSPAERFIAKQRRGRHSNDILTQLDLIPGLKETAPLLPEALKFRGIERGGQLYEAIQKLSGSDERTSQRVYAEFPAFMGGHFFNDAPEGKSPKPNLVFVLACKVAGIKTKAALLPPKTVEVIRRKIPAPKLR